MPSTDVLAIMSSVQFTSEMSPDPLGLEFDHGLDDCIQVTLPPLVKATVMSEPLKRTPTPRRRKVEPVIEIVSPKKRRQSVVELDAKRVRTRLTRASPSSNRATPTPTGKGSAERKALVKPTSGSPRMPVSRPSVSRPPAKTLASSVAKPLPTPSPAHARKRPRLSSPGGSGVFDDPTPSPASEISREAFLTNEALRRQREARKFVYVGDANAPKLTRSGKVVGEVREETEEAEDYGAMVEGDKGMNLDVVQELVTQKGPTLSTPLLKGILDTQTKLAPVIPLPVSARPHVLQILSILTSQSIGVDPPAFIDEEKNDALQGLMNLLRGTVERGEGNSALVIGARGVGKTRASP